MQDQTDQYQHLGLKKGQKVYKVNSGHVIALWCINMPTKSIHGHERMWLQGREIDPDTKQWAVRDDGSDAIHHNGHELHFHAEGDYHNYQDEKITLEEWFHLERQTYAETVARMSDRHDQVVSLSDHFVDASELDTDEIPEALHFLRPKKYDSSGQLIVEPFLGHTR